MDKLLKSCQNPHYKLDGAVYNNAWSKVANIPVPQGASLATLRGYVVALGGNDNLYGFLGAYNCTGKIYCYDSVTKLWSDIGCIPTPRSNVLVDVLPNNMLIMVGGEKRNGRFSWSYFNTTDIAFS